MKEEVNAFLRNYYSFEEEDFEEYYALVAHILEHPEFQKRKTFFHHGNETVFQHCLRVSFKAWKKAKKRGLHTKETAIGGLLHDFYTRPWQLKRLNKGFFQQHMFIHAKDALANAFAYFPEDMNPLTMDIILKHMFPWNRGIPKYKESWLVSSTDKSVSAKMLQDIPAYFLHTKQHIYDKDTD